MQQNIAAHPKFKLLLEKQKELEQWAKVVGEMQNKVKIWDKWAYEQFL